MIDKKVIILSGSISCCGNIKMSKKEVSGIVQSEFYLNNQKHFCIALDKPLKIKNNIFYAVTFPESSVKICES